MSIYQTIKVFRMAVTLSRVVLVGEQIVQASVSLKPAPVNI